MKEPVTTLDTRFSDPDAHAVDWDVTRRALETAELFWIATVRADGRPHITALVAAWLDDAIHFATGPDEQKAVNLRGNTHVILMTGCNRWQEGLDVVVDAYLVVSRARAHARGMSGYGVPVMMRTGAWRQTGLS